MNIAINKIVFDRKLLLLENCERTERQPLTTKRSSCPADMR